MLIDIELCQRTDVDPEFAFPGQCIRQLVIQAVNSLNDQNIILFQLFEAALVFPLSGLEIKTGKFYRFTAQQC